MQETEFIADRHQGLARIAERFGVADVVFLKSAHQSIGFSQCACIFRADKIYDGLKYLESAHFQFYCYDGAIVARKCRGRHLIFLGGGYYDALTTSIHVDVIAPPGRPLGEPDSVDAAYDYAMRHMAPTEIPDHMRAAQDAIKSRIVAAVVAQGIHEDLALIVVDYAYELARYARKICDEFERSRLQGGRASWAAVS